MYSIRKKGEREGDKDREAVTGRHGQERENKYIYIYIQIYVCIVQRAESVTAH